MRFYLGTHLPAWLGSLSVPLFVSHRRLSSLRRLPAARTAWALDSGGFSELSMYGRWQTTPATYAAAIARYRDEIGRLDWAAPQDWMCEPWITAKTGRTVAYHQAATIESLLELRSLVTGVQIVPVLQGWTRGDYLDHVDMYRRAGVDLTTELTIGLGSVCRRQATSEITAIVTDLASLGLHLHGFGIKTKGLGAYAHRLTSADSLAWSYNARRHPPLPGCQHQSCANCHRWALRWRADLLGQLTHHQTTLADALPNPATWWNVA